MSEPLDILDEALPPFDATAETLSITEAARVMRIGVDAVRRLIATGDLPALSLNRKHLVLLREQVVDFIRSKAQEQALQRRSGLDRGALIPVMGSDDLEQSERRGRPRRKLPTLD